MRVCCCVRCASRKCVSFSQFQLKIHVYKSVLCIHSIFRHCILVRAQPAINIKLEHCILNFFFEGKKTHLSLVYFRVNVLLRRHMNILSLSHSTLACHRPNTHTHARHNFEFVRCLFAIYPIAVYAVRCW